MAPDEFFGVTKNLLRGVILLSDRKKMFLGLLGIPKGPFFHFDPIFFVIYFSDNLGCCESVVKFLSKLEHYCSLENFFKSSGHNYPLTSLNKKKFMYIFIVMFTKPVYVPPDKNL